MMPDVRVAYGSSERVRFSASALAAEGYVNPTASPCWGALSDWPSTDPVTDDWIASSWEVIDGEYFISVLLPGTHAKGLWRMWGKLQYGAETVKAETGLLEIY